MTDTFQPCAKTFKELVFYKTGDEMVLVVWHNIKDKKPTAYDLVTVRDSKGKEQVGWYTGSNFKFYKRVVGDVVEWKAASACFISK